MGCCWCAWLGVMVCRDRKLGVAELSQAVSLMPPPLMFMLLGSLGRGEGWGPDIHEDCVLGRLVVSESGLRPALNDGNALMVPLALVIDWEVEVVWVGWRSAGFVLSMSDLIHAWWFWLLRLGLEGSCEWPLSLLVCVAGWLR